MPRRKIKRSRLLDDSSFRSRITEKLAHYYLVSQKLMAKVAEAVDRDVEVIRRLNQNIQERYKQNPRGPKEFPQDTGDVKTTVDGIWKFFRETDDYCLSPGETPIEMMDANWCCHLAIHFIIYNLVKHDVEVMAQAGEMAMTKYEEETGDNSRQDYLNRISARDGPKTKQTAFSGTRLNTPKQWRHIYTVGDEFDTVDEAGLPCTVKIVDHGSSAMKGEFYLIVKDIGGVEEISPDDMETLIVRAVSAPSDTA